MGTAFEIFCYDLTQPCWSSSTIPEVPLCGDFTKITCFRRLMVFASLMAFTLFLASFLFNRVTPIVF